MTPNTPAGGAVACFGIRRKGTDAVVGIVPEKIASTPPSSAEYARDYEEVPLYTQPPATVSADAVREISARLLGKTSSLHRMFCDELEALTRGEK